MVYRKLTPKQIDKLYEDTPSLISPYYPQRYLGSVGETVILLIMVARRAFRVESNPNTGDIWEEILVA